MPTPRDPRRDRHPEASSSVDRLADALAASRRPQARKRSQTVGKVQPAQHRRQSHAISAERNLAIRRRANSPVRAAGALALVLASEPSRSVVAAAPQARKGRMHTIEDVFMDVYGPLDRPVKGQARRSCVRADDFSTELNLLRANGPVSPSVNSDYLSLFAVLARFCQRQNWNPLVFSLELAEEFAAYVLTRRNRLGSPPAQIDAYFAAFNHVYYAAGLQRPWADTKGPMYELRQSYMGASKQLGAALGVEHPGLRVPVSGQGLNFVIESFLAERDHLLLSWWAAFIIMALLWLRADTMAGICTDDPLKPDVYFNARGYLCLVVRRIKRGGRGCTPFIRQVAPPAPTNTVRCALWDKLKRVVLLSGPDGRRLLGPALWGSTPRRVADIVSKKMNAMLPKSNMGVHETAYISSHSWRKMGASAGALLDIGWQNVMVWGCWKSQSSAQLYVDGRFQMDPILWAFYDFLVRPALGHLQQAGDAHAARFPQPIRQQGPSDSLYTEEDEGDDGCFRMSGLVAGIADV
jgi:hypothetical protein